MEAASRLTCPTMPPVCDTMASFHSANSPTSSVFSAPSPPSSAMAASTSPSHSAAAAGIPPVGFPPGFPGAGLPNGLFPPPGLGAAAAAAGLMNSYPGLFPRGFLGAAAAAGGLPRPPLPSEDEDDNVKDDPKVTLEQADLWKSFAGFGTEMVITKSGR